MRLLLVIIGSLIVTLTASFITTIIDQPVFLIRNFIGLVPVQNHGIAFSISFGQTPQSILILCALSFICWSAYKTQRTRLDDWGYGLLIGGALANIIDRLIDGAVEDIFKIGSFPIFNVADIAITIGVVLLILPSAWHKKKEVN